MSLFACGLSEDPVPAHAVGEAAGQALEGLGGERPDLVVMFASLHHVGAFEDIASAVTKILEPRVSFGGSAVAVIGGAREVENRPAISVFAACLPGTEVMPVRLEMLTTTDGEPAVIGWPGDPFSEQDGDADPGTLLLFADPFTFRSEILLERVTEGSVGTPGLQVIGGLASAAMHPGGNRLTVDGETHRSGAVGAYLRGGSVEVGTVVSQGCRPVGKPYIVTRAEGQFLIELGGRSALARFQETVAGATEEERELMRTGPQIGCVVDEARDEFDRGDFLVRGVLGADQNVGAIAVGDVVPVGRTVQFHIRDAASADEDLRAHLAGARADAALLFTCNGRGLHLFGEADHDASTVSELVGPIPLAGCFCAGEVGPIGDQNFLHGFTASLALFRERSVG